MATEWNFSGYVRQI